MTFDPLESAVVVLAWAAALWVVLDAGAWLLDWWQRRRENELTASGRHSDRQR